MGAALRISLVIAAALVAAPGMGVAADPEAERLADDSLTLCTRADGLEAGERGPALERALALAERARTRDDHLARAHFAVFCSLGRLVELRGIGLRTLGSVTAVREAIDRAAALAPNDVDVLVGRGALLLRLPRLLGGDTAEAEHCLRHALELDPWHAGARQYLAQLTGEPPVPPSASLSTAALHAD
jgi:hypothetical protein